MSASSSGFVPIAHARSMTYAAASASVELFFVGTRLCAIVMMPVITARIVLAKKPFATDHEGLRPEHVLRLRAHAGCFVADARRRDARRGFDETDHAVAFGIVPERGVVPRHRRLQEDVVDRPLDVEDHDVLPHRDEIIGRAAHTQHTRRKRVRPDLRSSRTPHDEREAAASWSTASRGCDTESGREGIAVAPRWCHD